MADKLWSELVFGTTPESCQAKLGVGVQKGFFEETLLWMEELANKGVVEARLPFLDQCHLEAAIIMSVCIDGNGYPNTSCHVPANNEVPIRLGQVCH